MPVPPATRRTRAARAAASTPRPSGARRGKASVWIHRHAGLRWSSTRPGAWAGTRLICSNVPKLAVRAYPNVAVPVCTRESLDLSHPGRVRVAIDHILCNASRFRSTSLLRESMDEYGGALGGIGGPGKAFVAFAGKLDRERWLVVSHAPEPAHERLFIVPRSGARIRRRSDSCGRPRRCHGRFHWIAGRRRGEWHLVQRRLHDGGKARGPRWPRSARGDRRVPPDRRDRACAGERDCAESDRARPRTHGQFPTSLCAA